MGRRYSRFSEDNSHFTLSHRNQPSQRENGKLNWGQTPADVGDRPQLAVRSALAEEEARDAGEESAEEMRGEDRAEDAEEWTNKALVRCKYNVHGMIDPFFFV
jgi:hypothetical protein